MQNSFEQKFAARLAARNSPEHVRMRLTLRFALLYFAMFVAGLLLCRYTPTGALPVIRTRLDGLFASPFAACELARDYVRTVLSATKAELFALVLLALSGMTLFSTAACETTLSLHALLFGVLCYGAIGQLLQSPPAIPHANIAFFVYFFAQLAYAAILLAAAVEAVVFSYRYRDACRALRAQRDDLSVRYILHMLSCAGTLPVVTTARALLMVIIEKL